MPFTKGNSGNPLGRPKGSLNSSTKEFRELLSHSIDSNKITMIFSNKYYPGTEEVMESEEGTRIRTRNKTR